MSYNDKRKKRIMRKFKIGEISSVDRPAQSPALSVIMKRNDDDDVEKGGDMVDALTSSEEGHQHGISIRQDDDEMYLMVHYATGEDAEGGHDHQVVVNASGEFIVSENMGHTHELDAEMVRNVMFSRLTNKRETETMLPEINNVMDLSLHLSKFEGVSLAPSKEVAEHVAKRAKALGMAELLPTEGMFVSILKNAADNGGGQHTGETTMPKTDTTATDTAVTELQAKLAKAEAFGNLTDVQKAHYETLVDEAKDSFLAKSSDERDAELTVAKASDAVVYKSLDGEEFHKSDDPRLVAMAKRADAQFKALEKAAEREADAAFEKRASEELNHLPGQKSTHVAILKAVDGIKDEELRKSAMEVLVAKNQASAVAFTTVGTTEVNKAAGDANAELERLAKAYQKEQGCGYYTAYDEVAKAYPDLINKAING